VIGMKIKIKKKYKKILRKSHTKQKDSGLERKNMKARGVHPTFE
jgi:hypothetical protein